MKMVTDEQMAVINSREASIFVDGVPGSGKTKTMIDWLGRFLGRPGVIITLTNRAADEIRSRAAKTDGAGSWFIGTLHQFAYSVVCQHYRELGYSEEPSVLEEDEEFAIYEECAADLGVKISKTKLKKCIRGRESHAGFDSIQVTFIKRQIELGVISYDMILVFATRVLSDPKLNHLPYDFLVVDEVQDLSAMDWSLVAEIGPREATLFAGDIRQAIYGFRGSKLSETEFNLSTSTHYKLRFSFRHSQRIAGVCNKVLGDADHVIKPMSENDGFVNVFEYESESLMVQQSAEWARNAFKAMGRGVALLTRTNALASQLDAAVRRLGVPVHSASARPDGWDDVLIVADFVTNPNRDYTAKRFFQRFYPESIPGWEAEAVMTSKPFVSVTPLAEADPVVRVDALWNAIFHRVGQPALDLAFRILQPFHGGDIRQALAALHRWDGEVQRGVYIGTIHSAKGLEWDSVRVVGCDDKSIPGRASTDDEIAEERRVMYVAASRAAKELDFAWARNRTVPFKPWKTEETTLSRFLEGLK